MAIRIRYKISNESFGMKISVTKIQILDDVKL